MFRSIYLSAAVLADMIQAASAGAPATKQVGYAFDATDQAYSMFIATDKGSGAPLTDKRGKLKLNVRAQSMRGKSGSGRMPLWVSTADLARAVEAAKDGTRVPTQLGYFYDQFGQSCSLFLAQDRDHQAPLTDKKGNFRLNVRAAKAQKKEEQVAAEPEVEDGELIEVIDIDDDLPY